MGETRPDANISVCDIQQYDPRQRFDMVIGNPPFNLKFDGTLSQFYCINKAYRMLNPAGLLLIIVPASFLADAFWEKSRVRTIARDFSFIGQTKLDEKAFASLGVTDFSTKVCDIGNLQCRKRLYRRKRGIVDIKLTTPPLFMLHGIANFAV